MSDVKKIAFADNMGPLPPFKTISSNPEGVGFWVCGWDEGNGVTEPGSSGSPAFDQNNHAVGQLAQNSGGDCSSGSVVDISGNPFTSFFGRIDLEWTAGSDNARQLKVWLDPDLTGANTLPGGTLQACDPHILPITSAVTSSTIQVAGITINASSIITAGTTVEYIAGQQVLLEPGFQADNLFDAFIQECFSVSDEIVRRRPDTLSQTSSAINSSLLQLFPNPTAAELTLQYSLTENTAETLQLLDIQGQIVQTFYQNKWLNTGNVEEKLYLNSSLAQGIYLLQLSNSKSVVVQKVVKLD